MQARVLALHDDSRKVVMLAMGEAGKISRIAGAYPPPPPPPPPIPSSPALDRTLMAWVAACAGPLLGAPFTFVAATAENATAPGQLTAAQMRGLYAAM